MIEKKPTFLSLAVIIGLPIVALLSSGLFYSPQNASVIDGSWSGQYEKNFDDNLSIHTLAIASLGNVQYQIFGEGKKGVVIGSDGWLFTDEDFNLGTAEIDNKLASIKTVASQLKQKHIELVVALIPDKSRIYAEHLGRYARPNSLAMRYENFRQTLIADGISTPDILSAYEKQKSTTELFLKTDTHWTPAGARLAAQVVFGEAGAKLSDQPKTQFKTELISALSYSGDLTKFIPLGALQNLGPKPDQLISEKTSESSSSSSLLDQGDVPIALVGTSYSAIETWNFSGALSNSFSLTIANEAKEGQGPMPPMYTYLASKDFTDHAPRMIIWEIPERYLPVPCVGQCD